MKPSAYEKAGVSISKAKQWVESVKPLAAQTERQGVMGSIGGFGGLFQLDPLKYKEPILVSSTDGVGTKLKIAIEANRHETIGIDLVAMNVNDVLTMGAEPLFFLDYLATAKLNIPVAVQILKGIAEGCKIANVALIGGETAQMPALYKAKDYDLAGFCVGIVEKNKLMDGTEIRLGDKIIGLASSGLHSNGFSLVRTLLLKKYKLKDPLPKMSEPLEKLLLTPTKIYVPLILPLLKQFQIHGMAHITGGGLLENIPRILPNSCMAKISQKTWTPPFIFQFLKRLGKLSDTDFYQTFNAGIGYVLIVDQTQAPDIVQSLKTQGQEAFIIGDIEKRKDHAIVIA
ncbi:MAG: phosphoribosylformylglycinamidine cyclo-ligase [Deltaproteobacteria bacterium]|nr:phosphoribosylformylglycinamidine cyclo-ligase [Deltaproteobacteria bacterium]